MRKNVKDLMAFITSKIDFPEPIVEIGSYQVEGQEGFADIRPFFPNKQFLGCDMRMGPGVDRIENLEKLGFADESVGTIIMLDTIEHVATIHQSMQEVYRVLIKGGWCVISSVMDFFIHDYPEDYWRFTPKGIEYLMKDFPWKRVFFQGPSFFPHTVFGICRKGEFSDIFLPLPEGWTGIDEQPKCEKHYNILTFAQAIDKLEKAEHELKNLKKTWYWKITAPLRKIMSYLRSKSYV